MDARIEQMLAGVRLHENPVSGQRIERVERELGARFPPDYKAFLAEHDGGVGRVGKSPIELWRLDEVLAKNEDSEMTRASPGLVVFADDGGAEAYAFRCREGECAEVGRIGVLAAGEHELERMGASFADFLAALERSG